jgi:excisionase family DNA binding protein
MAGPTAFVSHPTVCSWAYAVISCPALTPRRVVAAGFTLYAPGVLGSRAPNGDRGCPFSAPSDVRLWTGPSHRYRAPMRRPVDAVTLAEAAEILGTSVSSVRRHVLAGRLRAGRRRYKHRSLSRADVEALAASVYDWRGHAHHPDSYWLTGQRAADLYGVNRARLSELSRADRLPYVVHRDGVRLYRRQQLVVLGQARKGRLR